MVRRLVAGAGLAALLIPGALGAGAAGADPVDPQDRFTKAPSAGPIDPAVLPVGMDDTRTVKVMVQLSEASVAEVEATNGKELSKGQRKKIERDLIAQQEGVVKAAKAKGGTVLAQTQYALNGVKVAIARKDVASLAQEPGVKAVLPVATYELDNSTAVPYMGVPQVWEDTGYTGDGVKVAIIDTGIDYTHADFGGPGTVEAYEEADANDTTAGDSPYFGPDAPRVKGGYDFVGDDYDASVDGSVPVPDDDPLDCQGHGTHVAGSSAGSGVNADGSTYGGPYDTTTADNEFLIGPGVAPEADLYALRVFGCNGSTDVTVEAIEWAVENEMDVINMSLGSPYGLKDDASAIASRNAAAAGVVVVASAGNSGPSPYLTGAPGAGDGVISVAATDSTESYPGVAINLPDGTSIDAISANGVYPVEDAAHEVVVLEDIEGTPENEALGCTLESFKANGIVEGGNQLAVTTRGTCARVARAVYGEQAGAEAVVMINNTDDLPPYEGPITENPDDGVAFEVTIPFLGVRSSDGTKLRSAEGQTVTYTEKELANPGFTRAASFTSGGPRNGDSHLKPSVAAPGVAIDSAAVGTGSKGQRMSGTSMAAPMVAGVAALGVEAHPEWSGLEVANAIVTTADRDGVGGYRLTLTGNGLVDAMQTVTTDVLAYGDALLDGDAGQMLPTLSFGFEESAKNFNATKKVTLVNKGDTAQTYQVSTVASPQSTPASVTVSPSSVTVAPGATANVTVKLSASASDVPSSTAGDHAFYEISGQVRLSTESGDLNVPYLMVPRSIASGDVKGAPINLRKGGTTSTLVNKGGALPAAMDFYTWGLEDAQDVSTTGNSGYDLRAAGAQSFDLGDDQLLVFAINNWDRYSNAASLEHDIYIDTDGDGEPERGLYVLDYGLLVTGSADGVNHVFMHNLETNQLFLTYDAVSPTDSSTILVPALASDLGLQQGSDMTYEVMSWDLLGNGVDVMPGTATYNPWEKALSTDAEYVEVAPGASVKMDVSVDRDAWEAQKPLGQMVVVLDNAAGEDEALLLGGR